MPYEIIPYNKTSLFRKASQGLIPKHGYRLYLHAYATIMHGYQKADISNGLLARAFILFIHLIIDGIISPVNFNQILPGRFKRFDRIALVFHGKEK
jgi:hypothetical protein